MTFKAQAEYNYFPFGSVMQGRSYNNDKYRFGFNGMEEDISFNESLTSEWRQYDSRLVRWFSMDPLMEKFPGWSPYVFSLDNPILFADPLGDAPPSIKAIISKGKKGSKTFTNLLTKAGITESNYSDYISFGTAITYTEITKEAKIIMTKDNDIGFQVIKLVHELTNKINMSKTLLVNQSAKEGKITPKEYAKKVSQIEVAGQINQIIVASENGFRYSGKGVESLNKLIDDYSKDKSIDLKSKVKVSLKHMKRYEQEGKSAQEEYKKQHPEVKPVEAEPASIEPHADSGSAGPTGIPQVDYQQDKMTPAPIVMPIKNK